MADRVAERIVIGKLCRGHGRIYVLVRVADELACMSLSAHSRLTNGGSLPVQLCRMESGDEWLLMLPVIRASQLVVVEARDDKGQVVASASKPILSQRAQLESKYRSVTHDQAVVAMRSCGAQAQHDTYEITVDRVVATPDNEELLQGSATCVPADPSHAQEEVEIVVLGSRGLVISTRPWVCLHDSRQELVDVPGRLVRTIQFSVAIPRGVGSCVVWCRPVSDGAGPAGFMPLEPDRMRELRLAWSLQSRNAAVNPDYEQWYLSQHAASPAELDLQRHAVLGSRPRFSVIVPLFNTPLAYLEEMAGSVLRQSYPEFELVLVNASPENEALAGAVGALVARDERVRGIALDGNRGIAENTNAGIRAASGDFLCFLDHDDVLAPDALFCYARAINERPETDLLYSDEDNLDGLRHCNPYFKPEWEPDLLLGMNYVCHFLCVRRSLMDRMELPDSRYDGAQDHYLTLQASELARHIHHVPRILYHWRIHPGSTANNAGAKPYAIEAGRRAVQAHLDRTGACAKAICSVRVDGRYEVSYELKSRPLVSVIIPNKDAVPILDRCLCSIRAKTSYDAYEVVVVENNSVNDETFAYYDRIQSEDARVRVVRYVQDGPFNYSRLNNYGVEAAHGEYLLLLNNDTEVIMATWMERMLALCMRPSTGVVGAKLLYPDGTVQHAGVMATSPLGPLHTNKFFDHREVGYFETLRLMQDVSAVTGACLMTPRATYDEVGGLDPELAIDYNDVDYCWKVRKTGRLVVFDPSVELYHYESVSRAAHTVSSSSLQFEREQGLLRVRWPEYYLQADPASNPNLDRRSAYYQL